MTVRAVSHLNNKPLTDEQQEAFDASCSIVSRSRAKELLQLYKWKNGGCLAGLERPDIAFIDLQQVESNRVHLIRFHLLQINESIKGLDKWRQAPPLTLSLLRPPPPRQAAAANSILSSVLCFRLWWASLQAEV